MLLLRAHVVDETDRRGLPWSPALHDVGGELQVIHPTSSNQSNACAIIDCC